MRRFALLLLVPFFVSTPAFADDGPPARAAELKRRGDEAMESGRPAEAVAAYTEAHTLNADPALLFNKGRALHALAQYPSALVELEKFAREASPELRARVPGLERFIAEVKSKVSFLRVNVTVGGARIMLRDAVIGTTPMSAPIAVNAGPGRLEVSAEGYFTVTRELDLPGGGMSGVDITLVSKSRSGILAIGSSVKGASVSIDGAPKGTVPFEAVVEAGSHRIVVSHDGYKTASTEAVVAAGERRSLDIALAEEKSIVTRWWFWTAIGATVTGAVITGIALTTERSPDRGNVSPDLVLTGRSF